VLDGWGIGITEIRIVIEELGGEAEHAGDYKT